MVHGLLRIESRAIGAREIIAMSPLQLKNICKYWRLPQKLENVDLSLAKKIHGLLLAGGVHGIPRRMVSLQLLARPFAVLMDSLRGKEILPATNTSRTSVKLRSLTINGRKAKSQENLQRKDFCVSTAGRVRLRITML